MTKVNAIINCLLNGFRGTIDNTVWHSRLKGCYFQITMSFSAFARAAEGTFNAASSEDLFNSLRQFSRTLPQSRNGWGLIKVTFACLASRLGASRPGTTARARGHPVRCWPSRGPLGSLRGASKIAEPRGTVVETPVTTCSLQCIERWWLRARVHCGTFRQG